MKYDIVALGEILIDFAPAGRDDAGDLMFIRKAGGAPLNLLATVAKYGGKTAFIGKVGADMFGDFLKTTLDGVGVDRTYLKTDEVRALAVRLTLILALVSPLHSYLHAVYFTIRSGGKTLITFLFDSGYVWLVNVILAFVLCRFTALPLPLVYLIVHFSDAAKAVMGCAFVKKGSWATDLTQNN